MNVRFDRPRDEEFWAKADGRLTIMLELCQRWLLCEYGIHLVEITSFYRPMSTGSPHADFRAADLRMKHWPPGVAAALANWINLRFRYSPTAGKERFVCALFGDWDPAGKHWDHIHLQVPPATEDIVVRGRNPIGASPPQV